MKVESAKPIASNRLEFLDSLRGLAAVWVVLFHLIYIPVPNLDAPRWISSWVGAGHMGVPLFFLISAFSLCYTAPIHYRKPRPLASFYLHRLFRIAPLFYAILTLFIVQDLLLPEQNLSFNDIALSVLFIFNLFPGEQIGIVWASWTIGIEMIFYLLFPFILHYVNSARKALFFLVAAIVLAALAKATLGYVLVDANDYLQWSIVTYLPVFAGGMVVFYVWRSWLSAGGHRWMLGAALLGTAVALFVAMVEGRLGFDRQFYWRIIILALFLLGASQLPSAWVSGPVRAFLGKTSFSIYLLHPIVINSFEPVYHDIYAIPMPTSLKYLAAVAVTFIVLLPCAALTYRFIERPGIRLGNVLAQTRWLGGATVKPAAL